MKQFYETYVDVPKLVTLLRELFDKNRNFVNWVEFNYDFRYFEANPSRVGSPKHLILIGDLSCPKLAIQLLLKIRPYK